jgi:hypothetical protein
LNEKSKFHQQLHHKHELKHLYNIYVEIKHYNSLSPITLEWKIEISPKSIQTVRLSIPITMPSLKWIGQGVLNLQCDIRKIAYSLMNNLITLEWNIEISPKSIQTIRLSIPITMRSLKWTGKGVLNLQRDIRKIALKSRTIWWIKSHNSRMKIRNFTIKYTDRKTINSNNYVKFEVNWPRGF